MADFQTPVTGLIIPFYFLIIPDFAPIGDTIMIPDVIPPELLGM